MREQNVPDSGRVDCPKVSHLSVGHSVTPGTEAKTVPICPSLSHRNSDRLSVTYKNKIPFRIVTVPLYIHILTTHPHIHVIERVMRVDTWRRLVTRDTWRFLEIEERQKEAA